MLFVIFGEMGVGKNYVGEKLASYLECDFFDGDLVAPQTMVEKVSKFKPLSQEDIDIYVSMCLVPSINDRLNSNFQQKNLVVAQALYREEHRLFIEQVFGKENVCFIWLPVVSQKQHFKRLLSRAQGWKWVAYSLFNKFFFQKPSSQMEVATIFNIEGHDVTSQFIFLS